MEISSDFELKFMETLIDVLVNDHQRNVTWHVTIMKNVKKTSRGVYCNSTGLDCC